VGARYSQFTGSRPGKFSLQAAIYQFNGSTDVALMLIPQSGIEENSYF